MLPSSAFVTDNAYRRRYKPCKAGGEPYAPISYGRNGGKYQRNTYAAYYLGSTVHKCVSCISCAVQKASDRMNDTQRPIKAPRNNDSP